MKKLIFIFIISWGFCSTGYTQESIIVNGLAKGKQWQITEKTFYESGYTIGKFMPNENMLLTNWIHWNAITIQNRGIIKVDQSGQNASVSMIERSYKTKYKWEPAIGKLSKKNRKEYLQIIADNMSKINASKKLVADAVQNSKLFPAFKPVTRLFGVEWKLDSISQNIHSLKKELVLHFTITNTNSYPVKIDMGFWGRDVFNGVASTMKNYKPGGTGYERFISEMIPKQKATYAIHYSATAIIANIPLYKQLVNVGKKRGYLYIYNIKVPYNSD